MRILCLLFLCSLSSVFAQDNNSLSFYDSKTKTPIPFVTVNDSIVANIQGTISLNKPIHSVFHPEYDNRIVERNEDSIFLDQTRFTPFYYTDNSASFIISQALKNKKNNSPRAQAPFKYNSYNKFFIYTDKTNDTKNLINRLLSPFQVTIKNYKENHHIILSESYTERIYRGPYREEEVVQASKISGVDHPLLLSLNSQVQTFSYYDNYIRIAAKDYVGPLANRTLDRYHFQLVQEIPRDKDTLHIIKFYPKRYKYFESLKGFLYINSRDFALEHCIVYTAKDLENEIQIAHSSKRYESGWFPFQTSTTLAITDVGKNKAQFTIRAISNIFNLETHTNVKKHFSDVAFYYEENSFDSTKNWDELRYQPLTQNDINTYTFYDTIGQINNFTQAINFAEQIYFQKIPMKYYNIHIDKLLHYNDHVGPQIGFGASSNDKLSEHLQLDGYMAYGFNDKTSKYGLGANYKFNLSRPLSLRLSFSKDIREAGMHPRALYKNMYNTEWLRLLKLNLFERNVISSFSITSNPFNYFFIESGITQEFSSPNFNYSFTEDSITSYQLTSLELNLKYAYGERFFKLLNERISLGKPFPITWLSYKTNLNILNNDFRYHQLYMKSEYKLDLLGYGTLGIQCSAGKTWGSLPYARLFNGRGSYGVRTVAHNSFETMTYNEFLSSDFLFIFMSHDFGYFNFLNNKYFRPRIELVYNMGWGKLNNKTEHNGLPFNTLNKGYFELGTMINNLLILKINPTKIGLGVGYFHRMGYYRNPTFAGNSFFKLSTTFKL